MIKNFLLSSGVPLIIQKMKHIKSFVLGIWIKHGSRHETTSKNGLSHFIEHLFFQGTQRRDAKSISIEIDSIGGELNAFTTREFTTLYIKVLDKYLNKGIELIGDIFSNSIFPEKEIEKERSVILDEIRTIKDIPEELLHDLFMEYTYPDGLGQPILGKEETVINIKRDDILDCYRNYFKTQNIVITCAGSFDELNLIKTLEESITIENSNKVLPLSNSKFSSSINLFQKDLNEIHLCIGFELPPFNTPYRIPFIILNSILGGSVSSRLFQEIREKRGWVYNIYSFVSFYSDTGLLAIYTACEKKLLNKIIETIFKIIKTMRKNLQESEIERAKTQAISQILFSSESPNSVMQSLAYQEIYLGKTFSTNEIIKQINRTSFKDIKECISIINEKNFSLALLGPIDKNKLDI
ncbi:MAG: pitrilysin family protein [Thermodesulfovibrionaceae bacterium]